MAARAVYPSAERQTWTSVSSTATNPVTILPRFRSDCEVSMVLEHMTAFALSSQGKVRKVYRVERRGRSKGAMYGKGETKD